MLRSRIVVQGTFKISQNATITLDSVDMSAGIVIVEIDEIGGTPSLKLVGCGDFALPDTLQVDRPGGFAPNVGDQFEVLDFDSVSDAIDQVIGDIITGIELAQTFHDGTLTLLAESS